MSKAETETALTAPTTETKLMVREQLDMATLIQENIGPGGLELADLDVVKVPAGGGRSWQVPGQDDDQKAITGVIVAWQERRSYWRDEMSQGSTTPPDCASADTVFGVGNPGGPCVTCPMAKWGSGKNNSQACQLKRLVYIKRPGSIIPLVVQAPATSITVLRKYMMRLADHRLGYWQVETSLTLEHAQSKGGITYSRIKAEMARELDDEEWRDASAMKRAMAETLFHAPSHAEPGYAEPEEPPMSVEDEGSVPF